MPMAANVRLQRIDPVMGERDPSEVTLVYRNSTLPNINTYDLAT